MWVGGQQGRPCQWLSVRMVLSLVGGRSRQLHDENRTHAWAYPACASHSRAPAASMAVCCACVQACRWCCCGMASTLAYWAGTWQRCPASRWWVGGRGAFQLYILFPAVLSRCVSGQEGTTGQARRVHAGVGVVCTGARDASPTHCSSALRIKAAVCWAATAPPSALARPCLCLLPLLLLRLRTGTLHRAAVSRCRAMPLVLGGVSG